MIKMLISDYIDVMHKAEAMTFSMLISKNIKIESLESFNLFEAIKSIHKINSVCLNYQENELILDDNYEVHSVSASRDEDGDPEVFIHMLDVNTMETHSVRIYQFPQIDWLLQIVKAVNDKCELTFNIDEDDED